MVEPWVQRTLVLSGTFACAAVVFAYRDYALHGGFFVGLLAMNLLRSLVQPIAIAGLVIGWVSSLVWF